MGTDKNKKRYVITDSVQRRLQKISQDKYAEPPRIEKTRPEDPPLKLPDVMWGKAVDGITAGDAGGEVTIYHYDKENDTRKLSERKIYARAYGEDIDPDSDVVLHRVPGFWLAVLQDHVGNDAVGDTLEIFTMRSNWVGGTAAASFVNLSRPSWPTAYGRVEDPLGIFADILSRGGRGLSIRTRGNRHYAIQAKCDQTDLPEPDPVGACEVYFPGIPGVNCFVVTEAVCTLLGGTYQGDGTTSC